MKSSKATQIEADDSVQFEDLNAMPNNEGMAWDLEHGRKGVGYEPQVGRKRSE